MAKIGRRRVIERLGACVAAASLPAPWIRRAGAQGLKKIAIGGSIPLSGRAAETGLNVNNGYLTAVKYLNEVLGGVEIGGEKYLLDLKMFDDASDPARATTLIQRLIDEGVDFFLGSFGSNIVLPTAAICERAGKPMVQTGGGSDQIFNQGYKYIFGMFPRASMQFLSTALFYKSLKPLPKTVSVIVTNDAFSKTAAQGVVKDCKAQGFEILDQYQLPEQVTDVSSVLASVRAKKPDILSCVTHDQDSLLIARQMIASNTVVPLLFQGLGPQLASYREALGKYANGVCVHIYWDEHAPNKDKFFGSGQKFAEYYRQNFTRPIAYHTAGAAACIVTYVTAMQTAGSIKPDAVRAALAKTDIQTLYGPVKFTPEGDGDPELMGGVVGQVQHGQVELIFPDAAKTASLIYYPAPPWNQKA
jgi:branched-chain amino acid transport system substrate-binding protein